MLQQDLLKSERTLHEVSPRCWIEDQQAHRPLHDRMYTQQGSRALYAAHPVPGAHLNQGRQARSLDRESAELVYWEERPCRRRRRDSTKKKERSISTMRERRPTCLSRHNRPMAKARPVSSRRGRSTSRDEEGTVRPGPPQREGATQIDVDEGRAIRSKKERSDR